MNEQWQELKETITEMRDNNGTGTQQEVCKFLVNYMEILEKQMQKPSGDLIRRQDVIKVLTKNRVHFYDMVKITSELKKLPSVKQEPFINKPCISEGVCHEDKVKVLNKIRNDVKQLLNANPSYWNKCDVVNRYEVLAIIDKYAKGEGEC